MPFPLITATAGGFDESGSTTTHPVDLPASNPGQLLVFCISARYSSSGDITTPAGWTLKATHTHTTDNLILSIFEKISDGEETVVNVTTASSVTAVWSSWAIDGPGSLGAEFSTEINSVATGTSSAPNSGNLTASWGEGDYLWMSIIGWSPDFINVDNITYPTNYDLGQVANTPNSSFITGNAGSARQLTAESEDPGAYSLPSSQNHNAFTYVVKANPFGPPINGAIDLPELGVSGTMAPLSSIEGDIGLPSLTLFGIITEPSTIVLPTMSSTGVVVNGTVLTFNRDLPSLQVDGTVFNQQDFTGLVALPNLSVSGELISGRVFIGNISLLTPVVSGDTDAGAVSTGDITLPSMTLDGVIISDAFLTSAVVMPDLSVSGVITTPDGAVYKVLCGNTETLRFTEYSEYNYDYLLKFKGDYYGVNSEGIFKLDGDRDPEDAPINASVRFGFGDFGNAFTKRLPYIYGGYKRVGDGRLLVTVKPEGDEAVERKYPLLREKASELTRGRAKLAKGVKSRYWQLGVENTEGCDFEMDDLRVLYRVLSRKT